MAPRHDAASTFTSLDTVRMLPDVPETIVNKISTIDEMLADTGIK